MSKLKDLVGKGVRLIVTDTKSPLPADAPAAERDLLPDVFAGSEPRPVTRSEVAADVADFKAVYKEAGIELRPHGYGVDRVGEMLESKRLATLGREVKAAAVLAALETAGVPMRDVIEDAVLRDKALDAFEESKRRELEELRTRTQARVAAVKTEMDAFLKAQERGDGGPEEGRRGGEPHLPPAPDPKAARGGASARCGGALPGGRAQPHNDVTSSVAFPVPRQAGPGMSPEPERRSSPWRDN